MTTPENPVPQEQLPLPELLDGHGFGIECCPWQKDTDTAIAAAQVTRFNNRPPFRTLLMERVLAEFAGKDIPDTTTLTEPQRFVLGAYPKGTVIRMNVEMLDDEDNTKSEDTYLGILDQLKHPNGEYFDSIFYDYEDSIDTEDIELHATWDQEFFLGKAVHARFVVGKDRIENVYRVTRVEILAKGAKERLRKPAKKGIFQLIPKPSLG